MTNSILDAAFGEIPRASLEADPAVCFVLDDKLRLLYCNPAWDRFATEDGATHPHSGIVAATPCPGLHLGRIAGLLPTAL
jgi:hypothetical protein